MIELPYPVLRKFVVSHRDIIFVYSNDWFNKGCLGQAWELANEPNTFPVCTCNKLCPSSSNKFFRDAAIGLWKPLVDKRISEITRDSRPIVVLPKIGMGCSRMKELGPILYKYMWTELDKIRTEVIWKYQN